MMTASPDLVVRGGVVVNSDSTLRADVCIKDGRITALLAPDDGAPSRFPDVPELDASGLLVLPGGVDPHCHVGFTSGEFTSLDDYAEATKAAVFGGTTTIVDFAIPTGEESVTDAVERQRGQADRGYCDSALHACVVSWEADTADQLDALADDGIVTVKMFTTYRGETMANEQSILRTMAHLKKSGGMVYIHCESNTIVEDAQTRSAQAGRISADHHHLTRPELAETASVAAVLALAEFVDAPVYFVHQSTAEAVELVEDARRRGQKVYSESVVHHLTLDDSSYAGPHPERFVCCPPLRPRDSVSRLRSKVASGAISTIGSDHCCYDVHQKLSARHDVRQMPNGLPGVETRLPVAFSEFVSTGIMSLPQFVNLTSTTPARLNGLFPRKGIIAPGSDADIVLWDPGAETTISSSGLHMSTDYTPYEGMLIRGMPQTVLVRGHLVMVNREFISTERRGRHIRADPIFAATMQARSVDGA